MHHTFLHESTQAQSDAALAELDRAWHLPPTPAPHESLQLLYDAACLNTGGGQAARSVLFWLADQTDPTGYAGYGGLELRRLDRQLKHAVFEVMTWWSSSIQSDKPLYEILGKLRAQCTPPAKNSKGN